MSEDKFLASDTRVNRQSWTSSNLVVILELLKQKKKWNKLVIKI